VASVELRGLTKRYGTLAVVDDVSLRIEHGLLVCLLGPSGCGKSTVLRMIAGLGAPTAGAIDWPSGDHGARHQRGEARRDLSFVFQEPTLMPWADALANARLPLDLKRVARAQADAQAAAALSRVGLAGFERAFPRELSGGMKMRVSIARALAARPTLLLLDEPFAALDEITRNALGDDLLRLWREDGLTVVFVTHSVGESSYLSQRVLVMTPRPGRVSADIALPPGRDTRLTPATIEAQREISAALSQALAA
jgi:NitT/TauT family transport system ATP-binding protein